MLGGNEFRLRQGFRRGENACTALTRRPICDGAPEELGEGKSRAALRAALFSVPKNSFQE